ncbi:hypothetical protein IB277_04115 [Ensifer sp. ENS07]|uniref:hypothetical protein n=1 Tax=Ensifer sp. ENS07 TaxID=2769274 RepID=UPI00177F3F1C|nr:hypothetical protein [Ensifer sp. ENS07]MBD9635487.1 hypothetical protein [Ensifer sp. ENS07]
MDKIEKVARALAKVDGYDADEIIQGEWEVEDNDPEQHFKGKPRWTMYERDARRLSAAFAVLVSE